MGKIRAYFHKRRLRNRISTELELIEYLSEFDISWFLTLFVSESKRKVKTMEWDYGGFVFYFDGLFRIADRHKKELSGTERQYFYYEEPDFSNILGFLDSLGGYEPMDNVYRMEKADPFSLDGRTLFGSFNISVRTRNKRYARKRKVSKEHFLLWHRIVRKHEKEVDEALGFPFASFESFILEMAFLARAGNPTIHVADFSKTPKEDIPKMIDLLERKYIEGNFRLYQFSGDLFAPDFCMFEEQSFYILIDYLRTKNSNLSDKIMLERGDFLERMVWRGMEKINDKGENIRNVFINDDETDVLSLCDQGWIVIEAKSTKYDTAMLEGGNDNNCKNEIRKATKQIAKRMDDLINPPFELRIKKGDKAQFVGNKALNVVPLIVTFDDVYDFADETSGEAIQKDFYINPLVLSLDEFLAIADDCESADVFFEFVEERDVQKSRAMTHNVDEYMNYLIFAHRIKNLFIKSQLDFVEEVRGRIYSDHCLESYRSFFS